MKNLLIVLTFCMILLSTGCTLTESCQERNRRLCQVTDTNLKMMVMDWDTFWLYDRSSYLTYYHPRVGE